MTDEYTPCSYCGGTGEIETDDGMGAVCPECLMDDICPHCGAEMDVDIDADKNTCPRCGYEWSW